MRWVVELLRSAVHEVAGAGPRDEPAWERIGVRELEVVTAAGLAPLLHRVAADRLDRFPDPARKTLLAADWSARVQHEQRVAVAREVVALGDSLGVRVTPLKGISLAERLYPASHLRPMADVDLLVGSSDRQRLQRALLDRGFREGRHATDDEAPAVPLRSPSAPVWIEIHDRLFPRQSTWHSEALFGEESLDRHRVRATLRGDRTARLDDTLQLAYTAAYWVRDLARHPPHPSFVAPMLDAALLLGRHSREIDLAWLLDAPDGEVVVASLHLLIEQLTRLSLVEPGRIDVARIARSQSRVGRLERAAMHAFVDAFVLAGRRLPGAWRAPALWGTLLAHGSTPRKLLTLPMRYAFPPPVLG